MSSSKDFRSGRRPSRNGFEVDLRLVLAVGFAVAVFLVALAVAWPLMQVV